MLLFEGCEAWLSARAGGSGTGRFVARALLDSLVHGSPLVGLCIHLALNVTFADFVFARDGGRTSEVIRCRLGAAGQINECEVWRVLSPAPGPPLESSELLALLQGAGNVESVELFPGGLALRTRDGSVSISN